MPGVRAILHRANIGDMFRSTAGPGFAGIIDERRPPFEDDTIRYYGQYIALAVADTFEAPRPPPTPSELSTPPKSPTSKTSSPLTTSPTKSKPPSAKSRLESHRGDPDPAFASAPVQLDQTYVTPTETHNPIELHATVANWDGHTLTLYETIQGILNHAAPSGPDVRPPANERVRVITKFLGSGFGGKLWPWTHCPLAAAASRKLNRPVKLVVSRKMMFHTVGHRARTQQRVRLGATPDGKLVSLIHDYAYHTALLDHHHEDCGEATAFHYSVPNLRVPWGRANATSAPPRRCAAPARSPASTPPNPP